jgi:eukaryotic-like serine/threonine-protein kinase
MPFPPGSKLGTYEVIAPLGEGGMGAVYRARDARLNRDVAIKVIAESMAQDDTAMARFEREAMAVASLSHPNILSIYEFTRDAGTAFVVMELVAGETLRARLEQGPIPARKAVAYALQIARGLGAAHARGLVHRDLKPENVMVTPDDHVKILDFGLAKNTNPGGDNPQLGATRLAETTPGTVLGTFGYMAPEQVRGLAVDHRTDLFAFGALLYEMLSGARAFRGETAADTMSAILTKDPPEIDPQKVTMPSGLDRIVRRCLEKTPELRFQSPELRFQSANDLAFALETFTASSGASASNASSFGASTIGGHAATATQAASPARTNIWPWLIAGAALVAAAVGWIPRGSAGTAASPRYDKFTRISELAGEETDPALSPDGATVAYAVRLNNSWDIYTHANPERPATQRKRPGILS